MNTKHLLCINLLIVMGCASNPYKVKSVETEVTSQHGMVEGQMIAIDKDGQAIIQKETDAEVELREQRWKNVDLERSVQVKHESLTRCRKELADPRLGGNGEVPEIPELDVVNSLSSQKEQFGITEKGDLKVVKKEMYLDRLKSERRYESILQSADKMIGKYLDKCENSMRVARVKSGLPGERYKGIGYLYGGGEYHSTRPAEQSLDDAFKFRDEDKVAKLKE